MKNQLVHHRSIGDEQADALIQQLVAQEGIGFLRALMPFLADFKKLDFQSQPQLL